jgi:hypothetical protein
VNGLEITVVYTDENDDEKAHHLGVAGGAAQTTLLLAKHRKLSAARAQTGISCAT